MEAEIELLPHQLLFLDDVNTRYLALCGGYGCGKTFSFCVKAIDMALRNQGCEGAILEPTIDMARRTLIPEMTRLLTELGIDYVYKRADKEFYITCEDGSQSKVHVLSGENYTRLVGLNLAWWGVDEVDTIKSMDICKDLFKILTSRLRDKTAEVIQGFFTSTPEGFHFLYDTFVKNAKENRRIIHGRTYDNPYLEPTYIDSLLADYTEQQVHAYLEGKFVNLTSGTVYCNFDRVLNHSDEMLDANPKHVLHIGMDFNVGKCCGIVHIIKDGRPIAVDEITGIQNTEEMITEIKRRYPNRAIQVYPDASGKSGKTNSAQTDIKLLHQAGFKVIARNKNPFVRDRVNTMNARFCNSKGERFYKVNTHNCVVYTQSLEQQAWKNNEPDKSKDQDHPNDASGYFIYSTFPLMARASVRVR